MVYRCQNCDYMGTEVLENEDYDDICPECGCEGCIEFEEVTDEQEKALQYFYRDAKFVYEHYRHSEGCVEPIDNLKIVKQYSEANTDFEENYWFYTLVECEDNESWILPGIHRVNRIGYYITTEPYNMPIEGIREF